MRQLRRQLLCTLTAIATLVACPVAGAGSYLDPDARVFTIELPQHLGAAQAVALPDGAIVISPSQGRTALWLLRPDGTVSALPIYQPYINAIGPLGGDVVLSSGARVLRLRVPSQLTGIADLAAAAPPDESFEALAGLDDQTIVAIGAERRVWRIRMDGSAQRLPLGVAALPAIAPLAGGTFAFVQQRLNSPDRPRLVAVGPQGQQTVLSDNPLVVVSTGAVLASGDGRVLFVRETADVEHEELALAASDGTTQAVAVLPGPAPARDAQDGIPLTQLRRIQPLVVAADGSLLFDGEDGRLRAVVPADSPRPRIAIAPDVMRAVAEPALPYISGTDGALDLTVQLDGSVVMHVAGATVAGAGELPLPSTLPHGRLSLRLRFDGPAGIALSSLPLDTRTELPIRDARDAIAKVVTGRAADEGGGIETTVGRCVRRSPLAVRCVLIEAVWGSDLAHARSSTRTPKNWEDATLTDGAIRVQSVPFAPGDARPPPVLRLTFARHQHFGRAVRFTLALRAHAGAPVNATATIRIGRRHRTIHRRLRGIGIWHGYVPIRAVTSRPPRRRPLTVELGIAARANLGPDIYEMSRSDTLEVRAIGSSGTSRSAHTATSGRAKRCSRHLPDGHDCTRRLVQNSGLLHTRRSGVRVPLAPLARATLTIR